MSFESLYARFQHRFTSSSSGDNVLGVYVICVPERQEHMKTLMRTLPVRTVWYMRGIMPNELTRDDYTTFSLTYNEGSHVFEKPTKLCVHLSYLLCLSHAMRHGYANTLIFEDDIYFSVPVKEVMRVLDIFTTTDIYDVCYLGYCLCRECGDIVSSRSASPITFLPLPQQHFILCKHAIVYKTAYVRRIFDALLPLTTMSDRLFNEVNVRFGGRVAIPSEPIVFQDRKSFTSLNGNNYELQLFRPDKSKTR